MSGSFELFVGRRYLLSRRKHLFISLITLLSMAGVAVGVMTLITVIAVMTGTEYDLQSKILGVQPHVIVMRYGGPFADRPPGFAEIDRIEGVTMVEPFVVTQVMLRSKNGFSGAVLKGMVPTAFDTMGIAPVPATMPEPLQSASPPEIVVGKGLAEALKVQPGDLLYAVFAREQQSNVNRMPATRPFRVAGIFESGLAEIDKSFAAVHILSAQAIMQLGERVSGIEIRLEDAFDAPQVSETIQRKLDFPYWVTDWTRRNHNVFSALKLQKTVMFIIFSLIVVVAGFSITSTLIMMVLEKRKEIAIFKAMGATSRSIRRIFLIKGMIIASIGTCLGTGGALVLCTLLKRYQFVEIPKDVYYFSTLPIKLRILDMGLIVTATLLICLLASLYPAHRASQLNPVETIRNS